LALQGLKFGMGLHVLHIILLIPTDFVLRPKVCSYKATSQYRIEYYVNIKPTMSAFMINDKQVLLTKLTFE